MATPAPGTAEYQILQHPTNPTYNPKYLTNSDKQWARQYQPISNLIPRTRLVDDISYAEFDEGFLPLYRDDYARMNEPAVAPNPKHWRFEVEADCENWFNSEVSNVVLAAWFNYPSVLQTSHGKPLTDEYISECVDSTYSTRIGGHRVPLAIGEMKRGLINAERWQAGDISSREAQKRLSQELRGCGKAPTNRAS